MISNSIILGRNVYAKWTGFFFHLFTDDKVYTFGLWFFVLVVCFIFFLFVLFCLTYFRCHSSKDKQQTIVLLHTSLEFWSLLEVKQSQ